MRNNKKAGNAYELHIIHELKSMGYSAVSARYASRLSDDAGIDIISDFPYKIQCKSSINQPNAHEILTTKECDVIFFRKQAKANCNFVTKGEYVMLTKEDFYKLVNSKQ
jgi:hypothetical protein